MLALVGFTKIQIDEQFFTVYIATCHRSTWSVRRQVDSQRDDNEFGDCDYEDDRHHLSMTVTSRLYIDR